MYVIYVTHVRQDKSAKHEKHNSAYNVEILRVIHIRAGKFYEIFLSQTVCCYISKPDKRHLVRKETL